jgi:hypothetical protein
MVPTSVWLANRPSKCSTEDSEVDVEDAEAVMAIHPPKNYKVPALISSALVTRIVSFRIELD